MRGEVAMEKFLRASLIRRKARGEELRSALSGLFCVLFITGCATIQQRGESQTGRFEFGLIGDLPYTVEDERKFPNLIEDMNNANLAFVIHDGDFWWDGAGWNEKVGGLPPCSDAAFQDRIKLAHMSRHPFIFIPGDNEWTDCHRAKPNKFEPLERLEKVRVLFSSGDQSLGQRTMRLTRQSEDPKYAKFRENVRWTYGDVLFVTLHTVGSNNNLGRTPEMDAEYAERNAANLAWLRQAFDLAKGNAYRGVMIITQANPRFETTWPNRQQQRYLLGGLGLKSPEKRSATGYDEFLAALEKETLAFGKPVVLVHGDTHVFRIDKPLLSSTSERTIENFTRVETFGWPDSNWVRGIVDPNDPNVFTFKPEIVKKNLVDHSTK
jgi:hypothetical protein